MPNLEERPDPNSATRMQRVAELEPKRLVRPVLEVLSDGREQNGETIDRLVEEHLRLSAGELRRRGGNNVDFAKATLTWNRCLKDPRDPDTTKSRSGVWQITQRGEDALDALRKQPDAFRRPMNLAFGRWLDGVGVTPDSGFESEVAEPASPASDGEPSELMAWHASCTWTRLGCARSSSC
jgi:hypothetical protein